MPHRWTVAIIQARMGSTRFPGKSLALLRGRPLLWHLVHRLRRAERVDDVVLATTTEPCDDPLVAYAEQLGVPVVRGPEDNVLERYCMAARAAGAEVVVRVTGDAPLVDPGMIDALLAALEAEDAGFAIGEPGVPCAHEGFSPFTAEALFRLAREAGGDPAAREHITAYFKKHPDFVPIATVPIPPAVQLTGARLSVDTPADLRFLEAVHTELGAEAGELDVASVVALLRRRPDLLDINGHVHQKGVDERTHRVVMRCDGGARLGMGHVSRCLAVAEALRDHHGFGVRFAVHDEPVAADWIRRSGFAVDGPTDEPEADWLASLPSLERADALVLDVRTDLPPASIAELRRRGLYVAAIDDASDRRLACDVVFYPPAPQTAELDFGGAVGERMSGWPWVVLRREFSERAALTSGPYPSLPQAPRLVVSFGGSDPMGGTRLALEALESLVGRGALGADVKIDLIAGPAFGDAHALESARRTLGDRLTVHSAVTDMAALLGRASLAVVSFGVTAFELAALGVPALYLALTDDHARSASALERAGAGLLAGRLDNVDSARLGQLVAELLNDPERLAAMARAGRAHVDGRGADRIASMIAERVAERTSRRRKKEAA